MSHRRLLPPLTSLLAAAVLLLVVWGDTAATAQTPKACYNLKGDALAGTTYPPTKITRYTPCDASAAVSFCCFNDDYCLGNGLCLDNGSNGRFTLQGCTDPDWPPPCHGMFRAEGCQSSITPDYVPVWMCSSVNGRMEFCCHPENASCCTTANGTRPDAGVRGLGTYGQVWLPQDGPPGDHNGSGSSGGGGGGGGDDGGFDLGDKLGLGFAVLFGTLGLTVAVLQLRYVKRERKESTRSRRTGHGFVRDFLELWFPRKGRVSTVKGWYEEGGIELDADEPGGREQGEPQPEPQPEPRAVGPLPVGSARVWEMDAAGGLVELEGRAGVEMGARA